MRLVDLEMIEHRERIGVEMLVGVDVGAPRHVGRRIAARRIGDAAVAAREIAHLRLPIGVVGREFVQEEDRRSAPRLLEIEANIILGGGIGHFDFLSLLDAFPAPKIAVNACGRNAAGRALFRHEISAESPRNRSCAAT